MKKRVLSIIMVFTMLLSVFDQTSLTVAAEEGAVKSIMLDTSSLSAWSAEDGYDYLYFGKDSTTPIKWRILDTKTNTNGTGLFLLSENVFEEVRFSTEGINTYQGSNAQAWCNTFCDGKFSTAEKSAAIATSTADSRLNNDKVFFLSTEEATNLFSGDTTRIATDGASNKLWWLRTDLPPKGSADLSNPKVAFVGITGKVSSSGSSSSDELSARPAFNLNLTPIRFISAAEGGKPVGQLQTVNTYNGNAWKVTLADAARDGFQIQETAASAVPGGTVTISYTGAAEGANEYVSAMIVDSDNACLYYGQIASGSASGTAALTIPAGLTQGNYTIKVFSEQINGDKMTDYASAFCSLSLEVLPSPRYCVCGDADCPGTAEGHEIVDFLPLPATGGELAGSYYLDKDITLTSNIVVAEETTLNLSLNGHVLQGTSDTEATVIKNNGTLRICSYDTTTVHKFVPNAEGLWVRNEGAESDYETVYGGVITGSYGAIHNTGTAVMYHVNLIGSESMSGGGVSNMSGTFTMNGGSISGNKAENYGGVLNMGGTFTMNGGSISGNRATDYAGVANKNGGTFTMNGGSISENQAARNYGAVYSAGTFVIDGSKICDNTAKTYGGVSNASGSFTMKDSEISGNTSASGKACGLEMQGNMSISGKVIIANNTVASAQKNLSFKGAAITKDGALDSASSIGVGFFMPLAEGSPIKIATSGTHTLSSTDMERFFADSAEEHIEFYGEDGCGYLVAGAPPQEMTGVSAEGATKTYDGNEYGIHVSLTGDAAGATVTYGTVEGTYNLTESPKIKNVGTQTVYYKVIKEGYKNVTGSATVTINKKELNNAMFPSISAVTYDGSEKEPTVVLSDMAGSRELIQTSDYSISYSNNTAAGTATVTATAEAGGNYTGTASSTFTINPKSLEGAAVVLNQADNKYVQNGSTPIVPEVVTIDGVAMTKGTDYTLSGTTSATAIGAHILTVTGTGNYTGTTTVTWRILDANPPTGRIQIGTMESTEFLHGLSVGIRAKEAQSVTISGADAEELDKVYYYLFEDIYGIIPTEEQVKSLPDSSWTTLPLDANGTGSFIIQPDRAFGIYAKITDKSGNATYINSLGVFLDTTAPVIIGVKDGQSYCGETSVTVKDMTLFKVYLDGDGHNCFNSTYTFDVEPGEQVIKAVDYLGNETEITITVYETHDYGEWITDKEATATAEGMRHKECSHCGQKVVEVIPMIGDTDDGKVKKTVVLNPGAPEATLNNSIDSLRDSDILSQDDKTAMEGAVSATIWLEVTALEEDAVLDDDKSKIKEKARGLGCADTAIHYMDISLFKQLSSALSATQIHEPGTDMSVTIKIPEAIRNTNSSMIRTFYVLRVHGGVCEVVGQGNANTAGDFPFVTNKFSTYAIIYKDSPKPAPAVISPAAATEVKTGTVAKTGDEANLLGWMIAMLLGIVAMAGISVVYYKKKKDKKNEETP